MTYATIRESGETVTGYPRYDNTPVLPGYMTKPTGKVTADGKEHFIEVFCQFCNRAHSHGVYPDWKYTHKIAHCHSEDSPYDKTGYIIENMGFKM